MRYYVQFRGWKTKRRIVVIESDDWGSIRMPSMKAYRALAEKNSKVSSDPYCRYDTLESQSDLEALANVLIDLKDFSGRPPVITTNTIVANPRFDDIRQSGFERYSYEDFRDTYLRYGDGHSTLKVLQTVVRERLVFPQLHGREHVHVPLWLSELRKGQPELLHAFDHDCFGVPYMSSAKNLRKNLLASLDRTGLPNEQQFQERSISESAQIFEKQFGYTSRSFIAPAYTWHRSIEKSLSDVGISCIQGLPLQYEARLGTNTYTKRLHFTGQRNFHGQYYSVRNVFFEPNLNERFDWLNSAIKRVGEAFFFDKPAIISMHRLNFVGGLDIHARDRNLSLLKKFLSDILKKWPTVEFLTSEQLALQISK